MDLLRALPATSRAGALLAALAAGACATENHFNSVYAVVPPYRLVAGEETYRIYDRPDLQRLVISPDLEAAAMAHVVDHLPFNLANFSGSRSPGSAYFYPLQQYFVRTGRRCELINGYVLMTPQWEFAYQCQPGGPEPYAPEYVEPYK
jgi:hypothetical protein